MAMCGEPLTHCGTDHVTCKLATLRTAPTHVPWPWRAGTLADSDRNVGAAWVGTSLGWILQPTCKVNHFAKPVQTHEISCES